MNKVSIKSIVFSVCLAFGGYSAEAKILYMTPDGTADGTSWEAASSDLKAMLEAAQTGDEIWMAGGDYTVNGTAYIKEGVSIRGGFPVGATSLEDRQQTDPEKPYLFAEVTCIKGADVPAMRLLDRADKTSIWTTETYIDGITVKDHVTNDGRVCYFKEKVNLSNCRFINCGAGSSVTYFEDGGSVTNCLYDGTVSGNSVDLRRVKESADPVFIDNVEICNTRSCALAYYSTLGVNENNPDEMEGLLAGQISNVYIHDNHLTVPANYNPATDNGTSAGMAITHTLTRGLNITDILIENCSIETMGGVALLCKYIGSTRLSRAIIRNNESRADVTVVTKPSAIVYSENGLTMTSCLVHNNTTPDLCFNLIGGSYLNNTWANNIGGIYATQTYIGMVNNLIAGNTLNGASAPIKADNAFYSSFYNNALNKDIQFIAPVGGDPTAPNTSDVADNFVLEENGTFKKATSFCGIATSDEQLQEIIESDWSLSESSVCMGTGSVDYMNDWMKSYITNEPVPWYDVLYLTDLAGNARFTDDRISIGAYEEGNTNAIEQPVQSQEQWQISVAGREVAFRSTTGSEVSLYALNGSLLKTCNYEAGQHAMHVSQPGTYIFSIQNGNSAERRVIVIR